MLNWFNSRKEREVMQPSILEAEATSFGNRGVNCDKEWSVIRGGVRE
jgi:hypothetical protein